MKLVTVTGTFDDLHSKQVRFLEEAAKLGSVHVALWSDKAVQVQAGAPPKFPERERLYLLQSLRFVDRVTLVKDPIESDAMRHFDGARPDLWIVPEEDDNPTKRAFAQAQGIAYRVIEDRQLSGFAIPTFAPSDLRPERKRVMVTGCFDWFHSGHVRFFEEAASFGDLYAIVGHDANIRLLKGEGHPLLSEQERVYMVHAVRYVHQALISMGHGWMDAEPEVARIQPHVYVVNEDGDKPEKRVFCVGHGIEYVVLKRVPKEGLPKRESTIFRGF